MPLPPSSSRAHATVSRHLAVQNALASPLPHLCGRTGRVAALRRVRFRHPNILHRDVAVLDALEGDLVFAFLAAETGCRLVLADKARDLVIGEITRPDDGDITPWS